MKVEKEKIIEHVKHCMDRIRYNKERTELLQDFMKQKFSMPRGMVSNYIEQRLDVEDMSPTYLFMFVYGFDSISKDSSSLKYTREFYTDMEIKAFSEQKVKMDKIDFPITIPCIQIDSDQWIGACDVKFLMKLRGSRLINYNANAQRTMKHIVRGGSEFYRIAINKRAVSAIREAYLNGVYIPNTITLNIPESEGDFYYNPEERNLVINSITHFDIADGYHRYVAMSGIYDSNKDFNYQMELRVTHFSDTKTKQFIFQEDQKTKMRKIDSDSMNMSNNANVISERLNNDVMFLFHGQVRRNGGKINLAELSQVINYFYYTGQNRNNSDAKYSLDVQNTIRESINAIVQQDTEYLEKGFDYTDLMIIFTLLTKYNSVENAILVLQNKDKLDQKRFSLKNPRRAQVIDVENLYREVLNV